MKTSWQQLLELTRDEPFLVERVRLSRQAIAIEGQFELPPLGQLPFEDQVFVAAFVTSHGSIKEMERLFGASYPTIKNRLNRIAKTLGVFELEAPPSREDILDRLSNGEITAAEAVEQLRK